MIPVIDQVSGFVGFSASVVSEGSGGRGPPGSSIITIHVYVIVFFIRAPPSWEFVVFVGLLPFPFPLIWFPGVGVQWWDTIGFK